MLVERSPESKIFDKEGNHSNLPLKVLLHKSALSSVSVAQLMDGGDEEIGVDAGPCWCVSADQYRIAACDLLTTAL